MKFKRAISNDEWKELATRLPIGQKRRGFHECQTSFNKTGFEYGRDSDAVWCKCYRCGYARRHDLNHVVYRPADTQQIKVPSDLVPITEVIAKHPRRMLPALEAEQLLPYLGDLMASETYGRIYMPDDSGSYCGLDFTGNQFIPWRSPLRHSMAIKHRDSDELYIVAEACEYMDAFRNFEAGTAFVFAVDASTVSALITHVVAGRYKRVIIQHHPSAQRLAKELRTFCEVKIIGE
ncbi:hypothetical protein [Pantoea phage LIMEzero]|uniref:Uncharacterized protein n=1 Tax=Pantoea phage LIMEzero TaxID=943335 RepID=F4N9S0_9CAUD|nr:DNA primase [Pantoea phage LIMEzero]CBY88548.1 hypothetical protein [Pantoea phage LIMEzero]